MIVVDESEPVGEIEPPFESRDVQIRRGLNVRDFFTMEEEIGRGKFGTVFKCREKKTGLRLAAKFVQAAKKADRINVEREVEIMKSLRNPRLIQLYDAFDDGKKEICLLLELIEGGELFERVIDDDFVLTERACAIFMRQICEGIQFIHLQHVLHLDMKPENILCLTREGNRIKLIDFGLARRYDPSKKLQVLFGTPEFVAPEVVNFDLIGYGTDMWSVGIIGYVLLSGLSPFMGETDVETMANVTIAKYDFDDEAFNDVSAEAKDFICKLLVKQISKRMTATESLRHPWLRPRPPLPAPPAPAGQQQDLQQQSSSPSPTPPPCVDIVSSPVATPVVESIIEADVPIEAVAEQAAPVVAEISQDLVDDRPAVPDTEISDLVAEKPVPAAEDIQPVPVVEDIVPVVQADPALEQAELTVEQAVPVAEITYVQQAATELAVPVVEQEVPVAEKPVPVVLQQKVPTPEKPVPVTKKFFPLAPKPIPPTKKPSPMFEKAVFVTRKPIAEKPVAKKPTPAGQQQAPAVAKKPVPQAEKPMVAPKNVPAENKTEKTIQIVQQQPISSANTEKPVVQQAIPVTEKPTPISEQTILVPDPATNEPVPIAAPINKPSIPPKPTSISPTKEIQPAAPPDDILQVAKVNLRQFVERWNSHPNSPFQLSSDSPRRTISLLISASPSQREASPTSLTGMSPSPPSSLPMSPTTQNQLTTVVFDSFESTETSFESTTTTTNHVIDSNRMSVQQETTAPSSNTSVETAIEQTSALLKSVKESLIRQIESGTAVRDRTGARVWERKGSGISMGSPGPASTIIQNRSRATQMALASNETIKSEPKEEPAAAKPEADGSIEDWEIHPPVAAKTFGFAKRHKTISSVTVMTATEGMASSYSINSSSTTTVMESHQP